jgi:hypothetical protein
LTSAGDRLPFHGVTSRTRTEKGARYKERLAVSSAKSGDSWSMRTSMSADELAEMEMKYLRRHLEAIIPK